MANINSGMPIRWENGGTITIEEFGGATPDTIINVEAGTLRFKAGGREAIIYKDRGALQAAPPEGDERPTEVDIDVKVAPTVFTGTDQIWKRLVVAGTAGATPRFILVCRFPAYRGSATGDQLTFANCVMQEFPELQTGGENNGLDMIRLRFLDLEAFPVAATY